MTKKKLKKYLFESIMYQLEEKKRTKETQKLLDDVVKFENKFCKNFSDEEKKEFCSLTLKYALYHGSETCDEIEFAINFVVDLMLATR